MAEPGTTIVPKKPRGPNVDPYLPLLYNQPGAIGDAARAYGGYRTAQTAGDVYRQFSKPGAFNPTKMGQGYKGMSGLETIGAVASIGSAANRFSREKNLKSGVDLVGTAVLQSNPAGRALMAATGGRSLTQILGGFGISVGSNRRRKRQEAEARAAAESQYQNQLGQEMARQSNAMNAYNRMASGAANEAQMYKENMDTYRKMSRNLRQQGLASSDLAGLMGQFSAQNQMAGEAGRARLASGLAARGIAPTSGIGAGAMAGLESGLSAQQGAQMASARNAALNQALGMERQLFSGDVSGYQAALGRQMQAQTMSDEVALRERALQMQQEQQRIANEQAAYQRRAGESANLGNFLVGLYSAYANTRRPPVSITGATTPTETTPTATTRGFVPPSLTLPQQPQFGAGMRTPSTALDIYSQSPQLSLGNVGGGSALSGILNEKFPDAVVGQTESYLGSQYRKTSPMSWMRVG